MDARGRMNGENKGGRRMEEGKRGIMSLIDVLATERTVWLGV